MAVWILALVLMLVVALAVTKRRRTAGAPNIYEGIEQAAAADLTSDRELRAVILHARQVELIAEPRQAARYRAIRLRASAELERRWARRQS